MKYDVFISYSRKDMDAANALCLVLDSAGVSYWIDRNIHGSANFLSEITHNIRHCKVVVFIASPNSAVSPWAQKEILFALKHKKEIVPYRISDFCFEDNDELDFIFTNIQWIESPSAVVTALEELGCCKTTELKTYKIGDYYNENGKEGVVFEVTDDGLHGKIVSMTQSDGQLQWVSDKIEENRFIGANDEHNGIHNMTLISSIQDWQNKYPAFKWCVDLGEGWYLPSIEELKAFTLDPYVYYDVNRTIVANGGVKLFNIKSDWGFYWSSTEKNKQRSTGEYCAYYVHMYQGDVFHHNKGDYYSVRAVATF